MFQIIKIINGKNAYLKSTKEGIHCRWTGLSQLGAKFDANLTPKELHDIKNRFFADHVVLADPSSII